MNRAPARALVVSVCAFALSAGLIVAPASSAAPTLPNPGDGCSAKNFWKEIPVKNTSKNPAAKPSFTKAKDSRKADRFVCVPFGWYPEAGFDFKAPFGEWILERYPVRVKWNSELYKPNPEHDPCRITTAFSRKGTLTSYDRVADGYIPSVGRVRGLMVSVATQEGFDSSLQEAVSSMDETPEEALQSWWRDSAEIATYAEDYYWDQSRGRMNLSIDVDEDFHLLDPALLPRDWGTLDSAALIAALDADGVDFTGVNFVVFQVPEAARIRAFAARNPITVDGQLIQNSHGLARAMTGNEQARARFVLVHEMGHLLGLPDLYAETSQANDSGGGDNGYADRFALHHSIMHSSIEKGFTGYERWLLGWMPTKNVRCVLPDDAYAKSIGMSAVDSADDYGLKLVMFPVVGDSERMRVMELRGYSSGFWVPGILVYEIFGASNSARFTGLTPEDPRTARAPLTAYRDDWTTLQRSEPPPDPFTGSEASEWFGQYTAAIVDGAVPDSVRQSEESPSLEWDDGQVLLLDNLQFQNFQTRATLRYGFGQ